jgi:hypothetical protein
VLSAGEWHAKTAGCVCGLILHSINELAYYNIVGVLETQTTIISCGRNHAIKQALAVPGLTHVLFVDSDALFPVTTLKTLLEHDKDVIGCRALRRMPPYTPTGKKLENGKWVIGCHIMLIKMSVFSKIAFPWFDAHYNEDGSYMSEDYDFCNKVNKFSGVCVDEELSKQIGHLGEMNFTLGMYKEETKPL